MSLMNKSKILSGLVLITYILFVIFQFSDKQLIAFNLRSLILPFVALTYFVCVKEKSILFNWFLIFYAASELMDLIFYNTMSDTLYYLLGNSLYMLAYIMLIVDICKSLNFNQLIKNFKIHLIVLTGLSVYTVYVLQVIVHSYLELNYQYFIELIYNIVMLLLLSISLLNYFYRDNRKSLYMFVGSLLMVFSEVMSFAYLYVTHHYALNLIVVSLALLAFYFFYQQSKLTNDTPIHDVLVE